MVMNGKGLLAEFDRMRARLEEADERERLRLEAELVDAKVAMRLAEQAQRPKRSTMSAAEKSRYIRAQGLDAYQRLEW